MHFIYFCVAEFTEVRHCVVTSVVSCSEIGSHMEQDKVDEPIKFGNGTASISLVIIICSMRR